MLEFIPSIRGNAKLVHELYVYVKQKEITGGVVVYECEQRRGTGNNESKCKARIKVQGEDVIEMINAHSHGSDPQRSAYLRERTQIKEAATTSFQTTQRSSQDIWS